MTGHSTSHFRQLCGSRFSVPMLLQTKIGLGGLGLGLAGWYVYRKQQAPTLVVGGGVMGLSTACCLAATGRKVILVDACHPIRGSWGVTRASHFRMEDPTLLQMGLYSSKYWKALQQEYEAEAKRSELRVEDAHFYHCTGSAMAGPKEQIENIAICVKRELGNLPEGQHELLSPNEVSKRFPQLKLDEGESLIYMPIGFTMLVNNCISALHWKASRAGAEIIEDTVVHIDRQRKEVKTEGGGNELKMAPACFLSCAVLEHQWMFFRCFHCGP